MDEQRSEAHNTVHGSKTRVEQLIKLDKRSEKDSNFGVDITSHDPALGEAFYDCPLYRTTARYGALLTNGHSTNFLIMIKTPMPRDTLESDAVSHKTKSAADRCTSNHWIKRGAAMVCALSN